MPDQLKSFLDILKDWWELTALMLATMWAAIIKCIKRYKQIRSVEYKVAAIEKLMKEELTSEVRCTEVHNQCTSSNELRFLEVSKDLEAVKGQGARTVEQLTKLEERVDHVIDLLMEGKNGN